MSDRKDNQVTLTNVGTSPLTVTEINHDNADLDIKHTDTPF